MVTAEPVSLVPAATGAVPKARELWQEGSHVVAPVSGVVCEPGRPRARSQADPSSQPGR